jgi:hypothetical protein
MTDRELLEKAARSAGFERTRVLENGFFQVHGWREGYETDWEYWNPLSDDGDALRLAVKLGLDVTHGGQLVVAEKETKAGEGNGACEPYELDQYAATRRAIVRAAAAIGESK